MRISAWKAAAAIILGIVIVFLCQIAAMLADGALTALGLPEAIRCVITGAVYVFAALGLLRLLAGKLLRLSLSDLGVSKLRFRGVWVAAAFMLPLLVSAAFLLLPGSWEGGGHDASAVITRVAFACVYYGICTAIVEEAIFRGLIMTALQKRWNKAVAIIAPSVIFAALHVFSKPLDVLSFIQLLLAGTVVGVMFSLIKLESGCIWNSVLVHAVWNAIIIGGLLYIGTESSESNLINYVLETKSFALTGGDFGIEASVFALTGYIAVSCIAFFLIRKSRAAEPDAD